MTENQSVFSGGGHNPGSGGSPPPPELANIFNSMASRAIQRFLVDPTGLKLEMIFNPTTGIMTMKGGETTAEYAYKKL